MAKIKLTKNELKVQKDALKMYKRYLPTLTLKKQQLQSEIRTIEAKAKAVRKEREELEDTEIISRKTREMIKNGEYIIVTDRWQNDTDFVLNHENLDVLASYSDEFLIHAVDVEGKMGGIEGNLAKILGEFHEIPVTYAGGIHSFADLNELNLKGNGRLDATIGSALSLFGGPMKFEEVLAYFEKLK